MRPITGERPPPKPLQTDVVRLVIGGTALWFAGFVVLLVAGGAAHREWMWTCLAGWLLGLVGLRLAWTAQRREKAASRSSD